MVKAIPSLQNIIHKRAVDEKEVDLPTVGCLNLSHSELFRSMSGVTFGIPPTWWVSGVEKRD